MKNLEIRSMHPIGWLKKCLILPALMFSFTNLNAQRAATLTRINDEGTVQYFNAPGFFLYVDQDSIDVRPKNKRDYNYYTDNFYPEIKGKLKSFGATRVEYYTGNFYPEIKGKIKSIGNIELTYYTGNFYPEIKGKLKSIGNLQVSYYTGDFYPEIKGKIESIGDLQISYHTGDFYPEIKGKLKSVGSNIVTYYVGSFDPDKGRIKSVEGKLPITVISSEKKD